MNIININLMSW